VPSVTSSAPFVRSVRFRNDFVSIGFARREEVEHDELERAALQLALDAFRSSLRSVSVTGLPDSGDTLSYKIYYEASIQRIQGLVSAVRQRVAPLGWGLGDHCSNSRLVEAPVCPRS